MHVAGGAALHFHTGERVSVDVDAVFSRRIAVPDRLDVAYRDEDAHADSLPITLPGIDRRVLDVRILTPLDLAVSKLGCFSEQDRADIAALARRKLIDPANLELRATQALGGYVRDTTRLRGNIASARKIIAANKPKK